MFHDPEFDHEQQVEEATRMLKEYAQGVIRIALAVVDEISDDNIDKASTMGYLLSVQSANLSTSLQQLAASIAAHSPEISNPFDIG